MAGPTPPTLYARIYTLVARVPRGRVVTYGQVAAFVGCGARQVGYALAATPDGCEIPWQRVINSRGEVSPRRDGQGHLIQRLLLEREGVAFDLRGRVDLALCGWRRLGGRRLSVSRQSGGRCGRCGRSPRRRG